MISPAEAEAAIRAHVPSQPSETRPLESLAGAILRMPVHATRDQPPFDRVTMDGIALASRSYAAGQRKFNIVGTQAAGAAPLELPDLNACIEVMTGAMLPQGCDCVIPVEKLSVREGIALLAPDIVAAAGLNVHGRGTDCREGDSLLSAGMRLGPAEVAIVASTGKRQAGVSRAPRIMVISTGDELIEPGESTTAWQIYRSNVFGVLAALQRRGFTQLVQDHLPDDLEVLRARIRMHLDHHDVLILSGGVSMGRFDFIPQVLGELGIETVFHTIAQRPGKPMWFGVGSGKTVYALPGNPVSTLICLIRYVLPGIDAAMAATPLAPEQIALSVDFEVKPALAVFLPVNVAWHASGGLCAQARPTRGSGDFTSLTGTDGFVELPPGPRVLSQGTPVPLYRW